jgi:hypothetical protein
VRPFDGALLLKCKSGTEDYGGAFIENQSFGCIQWMLYAQKRNTNRAAMKMGVHPIVLHIVLMGLVVRVMH